VSTHDAHAWPELYFSGYGWLPFEPTPRADGQARPPSYTVEQGGSGADPSLTSGKNSKGAKNAKGSPLTKLELLNERGGEFGVPPAEPVAPPPSHVRRNVTLGLLALIAVALVVPSLVRVVQRRRRWRLATTPAELASAAWAELRASAIDAKAGWVDGLTPRATARVLRAEAAGLDAADAAALDRIVSVVQRAWYARDGVRLGADGLANDVNELRAAMLSEASRGERLMLRLWPRSVLMQARELGARFANVLDALDLAGARLRARLRPRHATSS
jgi:hypothetical protein